MSANSPGEVSVRASTSRAQIDALFAPNQDLGQVLAQVARLSVRLVMQPALQAEVTELVGRDRDQRGQQARLDYRNGHGELHVSTIAGPVVLERPRLHRTTEPFASRLLGKGVSAPMRRSRWCCRGSWVACASGAWRPRLTATDRPMHRS